jgi:hypothetical protein
MNLLDLRFTPDGYNGYGTKHPPIQHRKGIGFNGNHREGALEKAEAKRKRRGIRLRRDEMRIIESAAYRAGAVRRYLGVDWARGKDSFVEYIPFSRIHDPRSYPS